MVNRNGADEKSEREHEAIEDHVKTGKKKGPRGNYASPLRKSVALAQKIKSFLKDNPGSEEHMLIHSYTNDIDFPDTDKKYVEDTLKRMKESGMVQVVVVKSHHTAANDMPLYYPNDYYVEKSEPEVADVSSVTESEDLSDDNRAFAASIHAASSGDMSALIEVVAESTGVSKDMSDAEKAALRDFFQTLAPLVLSSPSDAQKILRAVQVMINGELARAKVKWETEHSEPGIIFDVKVAENGRITIPEPTREKYDLAKGKILTLKVVSQFTPPLKKCSVCGEPFDNYPGAQCQSCKEWTCAKCNLEHKCHYVCKVCGRRIELGKGIEYNYEVTGYLCDVCKRDLPGEGVSKLRPPSHS